jgi:hypothetical protein
MPLNEVYYCKQVHILLNFYCLSSLPISSLISVAAIRMHPSKCSSLRRVLVLDLTIFVKFNSCSFVIVSDNINKICFLISGKCFSSYSATQNYKKCTRTARNTWADGGLRTSVFLSKFVLCFLTFTHYCNNLIVRLARLVRYIQCLNWTFVRESRTRTQISRETSQNI